MKKRYYEIHSTLCDGAKDVQAVWLDNYKQARELVERLKMACALSRNWGIRSLL